MKQILFLTLISLFLCLSISQNGINLIKKWEGDPPELTAYKDTAGVWTIGYGTTSAVKSITGTEIHEGLTITKETAEEWLILSLNKYFIPRVNKYNNIYKWTQNEFDALCSFAYNLGSIDELVNNGKRKKSELTSYMKLYIYSGGKKENGLIDRRNEEIELFNKGGGDDGGDDDCSNIKEKSKCIAAHCKWTEQKAGTCSGPKCTGRTKTNCENTKGCTFVNEIDNCEVPICYGQSKYICESTEGCRFTPVNGSCSCEYCAIWKCNCLGDKDCEENEDMIDCVNSGCKWGNCEVINSADICTAKDEDECLDQSIYPTICGWVTTCERSECDTKKSFDECTSAKCTWTETGICEATVTSDNCKNEETSGTCVESVSCTGNTQETCGSSCTWIPETGICSKVDDKDSSSFIKSSVLIFLLLSLY